MSDIEKHVLRTGEWGAEFRCTPLVLSVFKDRKIFLGIHGPAHYAEHEILRFEENVAIEPYASYPGRLAAFNSMGAFSYSWTNTLPADTEIGRYSSLGVGISVLGEHHPIEWATSSAITYAHDIHQALAAAQCDFNQSQFEMVQFPNRKLPSPQIGNDVWIAQEVKLKRGITIGNGAVIGAGAVITKDVAPYMIVGGVPERVIRPRFNEQVIARLQASQWWSYGPSVLKQCDYRNPEKFLDDFDKAKRNHMIELYAPEKITFRDILNDLKGKL